MAHTELLAKIAAELHKPDGIEIISAADLPAALADVELNDLPGISKGMGARLLAAGVQDFTGLWALAPKQARAIWGSVEGERFWNGLHGFHTERPETKKSMFGHSRMLPHDWRNPEKVKICARLLTESAGRRVRRADVRATELTLSFRGSRVTDASGRRSDAQQWSREEVFAPARDDHTFLTALDKGLEEAERRLPFQPRSVSAMIHGLIGENEIMTDLFASSTDVSHGASATTGQAKWEKVSDVMDDLRAKLGPQALSMGPQTEVPGGYVGAKIAFGRIPDEADFSGPKIADEDTHFATF
ncbi:DNA polymerase-4 [Loktanella sp. DSM 29012]|uniref:DinB/UmuC family translesion DNA polymerase n=1 Tax=Loktanella sp. DSM 29012 TaxID=1881056 RepID=UPI0008B09A69|nr:type VI secretion protein ImpB [Loktanella sp. DSM 29012]SEQ82904.1 DNA polymerase-4 [Loktanella sp. DSM 29012]